MSIFVTFQPFVSSHASRSTLLASLGALPVYYCLVKNVSIYWRTGVTLRFTPMTLLDTYIPRSADHCSEHHHLERLSQYLSSSLFPTVVGFQIRLSTAV